jgi:2-keto-4-pentenoate hydratase
MNARTARAAEVLLTARSRRGVVPAFADELRPGSIAEAYAIQDGVADAIGPIGGWKVGAKDATAEPTCAPLCAAWIVASPATFERDRFTRHGIEAELAFTFARDLPPSRSAYGERDVAAAIASVHPVIEVVDSRFADMQAADSLSQLADSLSHGALVVGPGIAVPATFDVARQPVELRFGETLEFSGVNSNAAGNPLRLLAWLANHVAGRRGGLRRGDVVTTGSWSGLRFAAQRARVQARFPGIGEAGVDFT